MWEERKFRNGEERRVKIRKGGWMEGTMKKGWMVFAVVNLSKPETHTVW